MVVKGDQEKIKTLIKDTITLLCRNGLTFKNEFSIEALIGITLDKDDVFLVNINEIIRTELGEKLAASNQQTEEGASSEEAEAWDDASGDDTSQIINSPSRKRRRKRKQSADADASNASFPEDLSSHSEPPSKKESTSLHKNIKHENDEDSNDLVFVKQEVDNDWNSRTFLDHSEADRAPQQQDIMQGSLLPTSTQGINTVAGDGTPRSGTSATSSSQNMQSNLSYGPDEESHEQDEMYASSREQGEADGDQQKLFPDMSVYSNPDSEFNQFPMHCDLSVFKTPMSVGNFTYPWNREPRPVRTFEKTTCGKFVCGQCQKAFSSRGSLSSHQSREHEGRFPYICTFCGKGFHVKSNLAGHLVKHTAVKEFTCEHCGKEFSYKQSYVRHIKDRHGYPESDTSMQSIQKTE